MALLLGLAGLGGAAERPAGDATGREESVIVNLIVLFAAGRRVARAEEKEKDEQQEKKIKKIEPPHGTAPA